MPIPQQLWKGGAKLPTPDQIEYGEIAINYSKGNESISIKNAENEIITTNLNRGVGMSDPVSPSGTGEIFNSYIGSGCNSAFGAYSHAEGYGTLARGMYSHVEGGATSAIGDSSHAEGTLTTASGLCSHAEGTQTSAIGMASHAEGRGTQAKGNYSHAEGAASFAIAGNSHAEGSHTIASGNASHAEGYATSAIGAYSHAEGRGSKANGESSHAEGENTIASGITSHVEGSGTMAIGGYSHAEGYNTIAGGSYSHAEGYATSANGTYSHAEGRYTSANGNYSHVEGYYAEAVGSDSHAEGYNTIAGGSYSHAEGNYAVSKGMYSHAQNFYTAASAQSETAMGQYNKTNSNTTYSTTNIALSVGNGTSSVARGNAFTVQFNGAVKGDMSYSTPASDYAEMFEWEDGNPDNEDRVGYFVVLHAGKIKKATTNDKMILGIVSSTPGVIGNNPMRWNNKYANDEWGRPIYEEVEVPYTEMVEQEDGTMKEETVYRTEVHRKLNPEWRGEETFTERTERKEWAAVGLLGQILVRQDGSLVEDGICSTNDDGIATKSDQGFYVIKVLNSNQALILTISGKKSPSCLQVGDELPFTANIFLFFENSNLLLTFF